MWKWLACLLLFLAFTTASASKAYVIDINGPIGPATVDYVKRGLLTAEKNKADFFLIQLNTPGGLETSMRAINQAIINAPIPVITYVTPAGARAASAGTFIIYASHFAAMAPGTNIGAATPVNLAAMENAKETSSVYLKSKNDAAAYIRSLAQLHGRNAEWGEQAVQRAATLSANEAKKLNVINEVAPDTQHLIQQLNGKHVTIKGKTITLDTKNVQLIQLKTDWRYDLLTFITDPNIAYILMLLAIYGLFFEFSNPGLVLPGVVGIIALILTLYAFQLLPINYVGLTLILIGLAFLIFEVYVSSFGLIGLGGVFAFIIGSIMLFDIHDPHFQITWTLIFAMSAITVAFFFILFSLAIRSHKKAIVTGQEGLIGSEGEVLSSMNDQLVVRVLGEIWRAKADHALDVGETVRVRGVQGLTLFVEPTALKEKK